MFLYPCLRNLIVFQSRFYTYIIGHDKISGKYRILEINRSAPISDEILKISQHPLEYSSSEVENRIKELQAENGGMEILCKNAVCIWGFLKLSESYYLILVTKKKKVGSINGNLIYTIDETLSISLTWKPRQTKDELRYKNIVSLLDLSKNFYFSFSYDLTNSYQKNQTLNRLDSSVRRIRCDGMYVWNAFALKPLLDIDNNNDENKNGIGLQDGAVSINDWIVPIIYGYFKQKVIKLRHGVQIRYTLIGRRSRHFAGTRYLRRGVNR